jgi:tRNA(fMet)-specific endonuclease VapC
MTDFLLVDTDVASYLHKGDSRAEAYRGLTAHRALVVSFVTVAELYQWAAIHRWGAARRRGLEHFLHGFIVHESDPHLCWEWALVRAEARAAGRPIGTTDAWIAATARLYDLPLVTNNVRHFQPVSGVRMISEAGR